MRDTVIIVGSGRSGTTWIAETINFNNKYRLVFEPLNGKHVPEWSEYPNRLFINPNNKAHVAEDLIHKTIGGELTNEWINSFSTNLNAEKLIIKCIRMNLFLKWVNNTYPSIPIVFIIRHPLSSILSKVKLAWSADLDAVLNQSEFVEYALKDKKDLFTTYKSDLHSHLLLWCIENAVPLSQFKRGEMKVVFYENMAINPEKNIKELLEYIDEPYDKNILGSINKPSSTDWNGNRINISDDFSKHFDKNFLKDYQEIMKRFKLDRIYGLELMPKVDEDDIFSNYLPLGN
jgi:hypothetical protein